MLKDLSWETPYSPELSDSEIHIWRANIPGHTNEYLSILNKQETQKAERYYFGADRDSYASSRGILRKILGEYTGINPSEIRIKEDKHGKPYLMSPKDDVFFNVSHSHHLCLFAFSCHERIGIDVEHFLDQTCIEELSTVVFSEYEKNIFNTLPTKLRSKAILTCWTRKEAYLKATGLGLTHLLSEISVPFQDDKQSQFVSIIDERNKDTWLVYSFQPAYGYLAAIAVSKETRVKEHRIKFYNFNARA